MSAGERAPLLAGVDLERARLGAPATADDAHVLRLSRYVRAGSPWYLVVYNMGMALMNFFTVLGAFFFVLSAYDRVTPRCYELSGGPEDMNFAKGLCEVTALCFWTYPLVSSFVVVLVFLKNLYDTRLYYECLVHRILLDYGNSDATQSPAVWLMIAYGSLAFGMLYFVAPPGDTSPREYKSLIYGMLAYFSPVVSSLALFYSQWQIESHLIPLPKYTEVDPEKAASLLGQAAFVPEDHLRVAFEGVEETLDNQAQGAGGSGGRTLSSPEYFALLRSAAVLEVDRAKQVQQEAKLSGQTEQPSRSCTDSLMASCGFDVLPDELAMTMGNARRPEVLGTWYNLRRGYWVRRLLHSSHLDDERARSFRRWTRAYLGFVVFVAFLFVWMYLATTVTFLAYEHLLDPRKFDVPYLHLGVPVGSRLESAKSSVLTTTLSPLAKEIHHGLHHF